MNELKIGQKFVGKLKNMYQGAIIEIDEKMLIDDEDTLNFLHYYGFELIEKDVKQSGVEALEIPQEILVGLYRLLSGVPKSFSESAEVYDSAKPGMKQAHEWVLDWGNKNNINCRGEKDHERG